MLHKLLALSCKCTVFTVFTLMLWIVTLSFRDSWSLFLFSLLSLNLNDLDILWCHWNLDEVCWWTSFFGEISDEINLLYFRRLKFFALSLFLRSPLVDVLHSFLVCHQKVPIKLASIVLPLSFQILNSRVAFNITSVGDEPASINLVPFVGIFLLDSPMLLIKMLLLMIFWSLLDFDGLLSIILIDYERVDMFNLIGSMTAKKWPDIIYVPWLKLVIQIHDLYFA